MPDLNALAALLRDAADRLTEADKQITEASGDDPLYASTVRIDSLRGFIRLPARVKKALLRAKCETVSQLVAMTAESMLEVQDVGEKTMRDIEDWMFGHGLKFLGPKAVKPKRPVKAHDTAAQAGDDYVKVLPTRPYYALDEMKRAYIAGYNDGGSAGRAITCMTLDSLQQIAEDWTDGTLCPGLLPEDWVLGAIKRVRAVLGFEEYKARPARKVPAGAVDLPELTPPAPAPDCPVVPASTHADQQHPLLIGD